MVDKKDNAFLASNIKGLMMDLVGRWNRKMDEAQQETEFASVRPGDQRLFGSMRGRTTKMSEFHTKLGISRQAAHASIARLQTAGLVEVRATPGNSRDKSVHITKEGQRLRSFAAEQIREIEAECAQALGDEELETLRALLEKLCTHDIDDGDSG